MILVEPPSGGQAPFDAATAFARLLQLRGHDAFVSSARLPDSLGRVQKFEAAQTVADDADQNIDRVILIGADRLDAATLSRIRSLRLSPDVPVHALGYFKSEQQEITALSKLSDAMGYTPQAVNLATLLAKPWVERPYGLTFAVNDAPASEPSDRLHICMYLPDDMLKKGSALEQIGIISFFPRVKLSLIVSAGEMKDLRKRLDRRIALYGYSEIHPDTLAEHTDIGIFFGNVVPGERLASYATHLLAGGGIVVDCTSQNALSKTGAPVMMGPSSLPSLAVLLRETVIPHRRQITAEVVTSPWRAEADISILETALGLERPDCATHARAAKRQGSILFVPTNGVGLGHAQRCALIAEELQSRETARFAAFPSCIPMLSAKGFKCFSLVSKSDVHTDTFANDIINYRRIARNLTRDDHLVFDGGYVFDSLFRGILESGARGTWIRRGLWQPGQMERTPVDREHVFQQVIVPSEAFDELNSPISFGPNIKPVGPIVARTRLSPDDIAPMRDKLARKTGYPFEKLVISMLGGGVAADRTAQVKTVCAHLATRPDILHLVVVWPNAKIAADLFQWPNTFVVRTKQAIDLCVAADFVVSAAGYNSFNEIIYHRVPAIFIPQMAGFMDDQESRAKSAADRGIAALVDAEQLLKLRHELDAFIGGDRIPSIATAFETVTLPERGNRQAAEIIESPI
ncbi:hypothetical protein HKCCE3408_15120 [Rhodobacterales bacterium HKCCE3408]|nr:hypothetical protein [Rhodobacterales bacterium HKCCE3408]